MIELLYRGFDGLDVSFQGRITDQLSRALEAAKADAQKFRSPKPLECNGVHIMVAETGAQGGYAFRASTGEFGATWFFKKPNLNDPWGVRVSCSSFLLATKGLGGARADIYATLDALGASVPVGGESIGRVDYALDYLAPGLVLNPDHFVMHSNARRADHYEVQELGVSGRSGRVTSVTVGKMPGRQMIVYDKRAEIIAKRKPAWWDIWDATRSKAGLPALVRDDSIQHAIWRVELRAGKKHLKDRWRIATWQELDARCGDMFAASLEAVRYTLPIGDGNRSRWPDTALWQSVRQEVSDDLFEMRNFADPDLIKTVQRDEHATLLACQEIGLLTTRAAILGISASRLAEFAEFSGVQMARTIKEDAERHARKLVEAASRYHVIS